MVTIPLYLLDVDEATLNVYVVFAALQAVLIHCNTRISFGWLKYDFVTPQFHHWHYSSEKLAIDTNYSAHIVLFDWLFNTFHMPEEHWPAEYGTTKKNTTQLFWANASSCLTFIQKVSYYFSDCE